MSYRATIYNVMIGSPSDVPAERNTVRQVLEEWNVVNAENRQLVLLPLGWETHSIPEMGAHPQAILNKQILKRGDLLVGVFWTRVGTPTERHISGSVEEIEKHITAGKPAMLYFSNQPVRLDSVDHEQYSQLATFKKSCRERGLLEEYNDVADFRAKFYRQLQVRLNTDAYFTAGAPDIDLTIGDVVEAARTSAPSLSAEAQALLKAAVGGDGTIMRLAYLGGTTVSAAGRNFVDGNDRRAIARWEAAVNELEREGLVEDKAGKRELYFVTNGGYAYADSLPPTPSTAA